MIRCIRSRLRGEADGRILIGTLIGPLAITVAAALLLVIAVVALTARRLRAQDQFELGTVSQQWLLGHKDEH